MPPRRTDGVPVERIEVEVYRVPTDAPESDGTYAWDATTMVLVALDAAGRRGIGYTYASPAAAEVVRGSLADVVRGRDAFGVRRRNAEMRAAVRNLGIPGTCALAVSAVDVALWDLVARLLEVPLARLLGASADAAVPVYGSGGFTSYDDARLERQLAGWVEAGIPRVKMKVGREPGRDPHRVAVARRAIGDAALFVDANGALSPKQALDAARRFAEQGVSWFEEPVPSDDLAGLRLVRERGPAGMDVAAGEYAFRALDLRRLLEAGAVDVLQADATRCGGITGFLAAAALCSAFSRPLSAHCAPALHLSVCAALPEVRHLEYFHDHVRLERLLFDGVPEQAAGALRPDLSRPGHGLELRRADAARFAA